MWQSHLARWPDLFNTTIISVTGNTQSKLSWEQLLTVIKEIVFRKFATDENVVATRYENGIDRIWGLEPLPRNRRPGEDNPRDWHYANATPGGKYTLGNAKFHTDPDLMNWSHWRQWRDSAYGNPNWVLNGRIDTRKKNVDPNSIYDITAYAHGSLATHYITGPFAKGILIKAVRASGAFGDYQGAVSYTPDWVIAMLLQLITGQAEWGEDIKEPLTERKRRVSDGGGEDNTGVYSLVRRGVGEIIMVDAGADKDSNMEDLCRLKQLLTVSDGKDHPGLTLTIKNLPELDNLCLNPSKLYYNTSALMNPVMEGEILWPRDKRTGQYTMPPIKLWYIKLAWNQATVGSAFSNNTCGKKESNYTSCMVTAYYGHNTDMAKYGRMFSPILVRWQ